MRFTVLQKRHIVEMNKVTNETNNAPDFVKYVLNQNIPETE